MNFKAFTTMVMPAVHQHVGLTRRAEVYSFFRGVNRPAMEKTVELVGTYFSDFSLAQQYHHEGAGDGSGFTAVHCKYGVVPCILQIHFYQGAVEFLVFRLDTHDFTRTRMPGLLLYSGSVHTPRLEIHEEMFFSNVLR